MGLSHDAMGLSSDTMYGTPREKSRRNETFERWYGTERRGNYGTCTGRDRAVRRASPGLVQSPDYVFIRNTSSTVTFQTCLGSRFTSCLAAADCAPCQDLQFCRGGLLELRSERVFSKIQQYLRYSTLVVLGYSIG